VDRRRTVHWDKFGIPAYEPQYWPAFPDGWWYDHAKAARIAVDGEIPLNPHGGQLSAGRLHGYGQLYEAAVQLRGIGGGRQVAGAEVAAVSTGGGHPGGTFLFVRG